MILRKTVKIDVSTNFGHFYFWVQKAGSMSGPHQGQQVVHILAQLFEDQCEPFIDAELLFQFLILGG